MVIKFEIQNIKPKTLMAEPIYLPFPLEFHRTLEPRDPVTYSFEEQALCGRPQPPSETCDWNEKTTWGPLRNAEF